VITSGIASAAIASIVAVAIAWMALVLVSAYWHRRALALPIDILTPDVRVLEYPRVDTALPIAAQRRSNLRAFVQDSGRTGVVPREFLECPPSLGGEVRGRSFEDDRPAAAAHTALLWWQLQDDRLLLMERLVDALVCLQRIKFRQTRFQFTAVLAPVRGKTGKGVYPWRAVLHTADYELLERELAPMGEWLGIGVDIRPPIPNHPLGRCRADGELGQVGGVLHSPPPASQEYGVTCHHVLADRCGSLYWPQPPNRPAYADYESGSVDAALITTDSGCFVESGAVRHPIACATAADRERYISGKLVVTKSPRLNGRTGNILHLVHSIPGRDGQQIRGPHLQIVPTFTRKFGLVWPLFGHAFSIGGNSGAWVTDEQGSLWLGMIVRGSDPPLTISYALEAAYLLDVFSRALPHEVPLIPARLI
jgi:hypothetical protein